MRLLLVALVLLAAGPARADDDAHLLAGVRAFQAGHYDEALVELRLVERSPRRPDDLAFYLGPTLYKLGRYSEALVIFRRSRAAPDALSQLYLGQTLYQLGLYTGAREAFASAIARGLGPKLDAAARRYLELVDRLYATPPGAVAVEAYLDAGLRLAARGEQELAAAYLEEAHRVSLRGGRHRYRDIVAALADLASRAGPPSAQGRELPASTGP